ncbi:MAG: transglycosylase SLT domain-containing protein [Burkholderiales bacterium]
MLRPLWLLVALACCAMQPLQAQVVAGIAVSPQPASAEGATPAPVLVAETLREHALIKLLRSDASRYEHGDGVPVDGERAALLYCEAARLGDAASQYNLGWMYTNGRGVKRSDSLAAFFFNAAAEQGDQASQRMLRTVGGPTKEVPECMHEPEPARTVTARVAPGLPATGTALPLADGSMLPIAAPKALADLVKRIAPEFKLQPELVLAVMQQESGFNTVALSPRNAKGLMQLIPETAARFNVRNPYDPEQNIRGGMAYLRWLLAYFEGDVKLVLAAYNAGEGAVERYRGVPPYLETRAYVLRILATLGNWTQPFDASVTAPSAELRRIREPRRVPAR